MALFDRPLLMWVTNRKRSDVTLPELARPASLGGVDLVQIREPDLDRLPEELLARSIKSVVQSPTLIVINSRIDLARKLRIGVHLPEAGPSIYDARSVLGSEALIGRSVHSPEAAAASTGASYLIAGHVFETGSKQGREPIGLDRLTEIVTRSPVPVLAIGGITPERVPALMACGVSGIAVMSPLTRLDTVEEMAKVYRNALERSMPDSNSEIITATINGKPVELQSATTVSAFLAGRELHERLVVVERNGEIIKRATFPQVIIEEGDLLEIVHFVGGG